MANINDYKKNIIPFYKPANFIVNKAKGSLVWDKKNKKYIKKYITPNCNEEIS